MDLSNLFRFPIFGAGSFQHHIVAITGAAAPATIRKWNYLSIMLFLGAFVASWLQYRFVAPFVLLLLLINDWKRMDLKGWTLIMLLFGMQMVRFFMSGRW